MPVTKMRTTQRQTVSSVVVNTTVESFSSATRVKSFTHSRSSSGKMLEGWSFPNLALTDAVGSPQTWVPGSQAVFLSPKSPSPKMRVTRRSSVYVKKSGTGKSQSPGRGKGEFDFKAPLPGKPKAKVLSPPLSSRTRRSSIYKKGSMGATTVTSVQIAQEFKTKSPNVKPASKDKQSSKSMKPKSPVTTKVGRKRNITDLEKEDSPETRPAKRSRNQLKVESPKSSPSGKKSASGKKEVSKAKAKSKIVKSQQIASSRKKKSAPTPRKKTVKKSPAPSQSETPSTDKKSKNRTTGRRSKLEEADQGSKEEGMSSNAKTQKRKGKVPGDSPSATTPEKKGKSSPRKSARAARSASKSKSAKSSRRRAATKVLDSSIQLETPDQIASTPAGQSRSASSKKGMTSQKRSARVSKSSVQKSASKSSKRSAVRAKSAKKSARGDTMLNEKAADTVDGSFTTKEKISASKSLSSMKKTSKSSQKRSAGKSVSKSPKGKSVSKSVARHITFSSEDGDDLEGSSLQVSLTKLKTPLTPYPKADGGKTTPFKSPISVSRSQESRSEAKSTSKSSTKGKAQTARLSNSFASIEKDTKKVEADPMTPKMKQRGITPSPSASSRLRTIQKSASSSVKRLNLSPKRTHRFDSLDMSTPKSAGKRLSLRKSLLTSLQKSANLSRNLNNDSFSSRLQDRELVLAGTTQGRTSIVHQSLDGSNMSLASSRPSLGKQSYSSFTQFVERKASNTVERYGTAAIERTEGSLSYRAGGYRIERGNGAQVESVEGFEEWAEDANQNNSALSDSDSGDVVFGTTSYSSRCSIM